MTRSMTVKHDDTAEFFSESLSHIDRINGKTNLNTLQIRFQLADSLFRLDKFSDCVDIWSRCIHDLNRINYNRILEYLFGIPSRCKTLREECLKVAKFNIDFVHKRAGMGLAEDILRVEFSEIILEQLCEKLTQLICLKKADDIWKVWDTDFDQSFSEHEDLSRIRKLANEAFPILIEKKLSREAAVIYDYVFSGIFCDIIEFENFDGGNLNCPAVEQETLTFLTTMTSSLQKARECGLTVNSKSKYKMKILNKFKVGFGGRSINSITLENVQFRKSELIAALENYPQLESVKMIGGCSDKVYLPKLKVFDIDLLGDTLLNELIDKHWFYSVMCSVSFVCKKMKTNDWELCDLMGEEKDTYISLRGKSVRKKSIDNSIQCELNSITDSSILQKFRFPCNDLTLKYCTVSADSFVHFRQSLVHLTLVNTIFSPPNESWLEHLPHLKSLHYDEKSGSRASLYDRKYITRGSLDICTFPSTIMTLKLVSVDLLQRQGWRNEYPVLNIISLEDVTVPKNITSMLHLFQACMEVSIKDIYQIQVWKSFIKLLNQCQHLQTLRFDSPVSLDICTLPRGLRVLELVSVKLEHHHGWRKSPQQIENIYLEGVSVLPDEAALIHLFGDCQKLFIKDMNHILNKKIFIEAIMRIDSVELICINHDEPPGIIEQLAMGFGIPMLNWNFCLERKGTKTNNTESNRTAIGWTSSLSLVSVLEGAVSRFSFGVMYALSKELPKSRLFGLSRLGKGEFEKLRNGIFYPNF